MCSWWRCSSSPPNRCFRIACHARRAPMSRSPRGEWTMHDELGSVIRDVRRRWRLRLALRGLTWVIGVTAVMLLIASFGMERLGFTPQSILVARGVASVALLAVGLVLLVRPLARRVPDRRVALYLEEHGPTLGAAVVSAVEQREMGYLRAPQSEALAKGAAAAAVTRLRSVE